MKKIDFHMHTVSTISDRPFEFSLDILKHYVNAASLDAIAITNHNMFDLAQFRMIKDALSIDVFPGIEIDLEGCHLLLIADDKELVDFNSRCTRITSEIPTKDVSITFEKLSEIFTDLNKYILIPHYQKSPEISPETLKKFGSLITAGEVTSPKKFIYCLNDEKFLVPVCFSDLRIDKRLQNIPARQTYLDLGILSLSSIKTCLRDKQKVFLTESDGHKFFDALNNGLKLSTGLNVIVGERSTGKSHTLDEISEQCEEVKIKYIRQFALLERDQDEDIRTFSENINRSQSAITEEYLIELKSVIEDVIDIDIHENERAAENYISSLKKHATETEKHDAFSKAKLFNESEFTDSDTNAIRDLVSSVTNLLENSEYRSTIESFVNISDLQALAVALINTHNTEQELLLKKRYLNDLLISVKNDLRVRSASHPIEDFDFYKYLIDRKKVEKFSLVVERVKKEKEILRADIQGYQRVARRVPYKGAQELKNMSKKVASFAGAYSKYGSPYDYLSMLLNIENLEVVELYKYFVRIDYEILNSDGFRVSGGERSEYRLLREIKNAQRYDMLMLDEPESSFDNLFLLKKANALIKDISKTMPVIVVTHSSTVGASIKPDYIVYTKKVIDANGVSYELYSGYPTDSSLTGLDGSLIKNHEVLMNSLEAGETSYIERGIGYETLKD
jgi:predicted ATPase